MFSMRKGYNALVNLGLNRRDYPDYLVRKAKLSNVLAAVSLISGVAVNLMFWEVDIIGPRVVMGVNFLVLVLNSKGYHRISRWLVCLTLPAIILYIACLISPQGVNIPPGRLLSFVTLLLPLMLFDLREPYQLAFFLTYSIACFFGFEVFKDVLRRGEGLPFVVQTFPRIVLSVVSILLFVVGLLYLHYFNYQAENRVAELLAETQESNEELRVQNEIIDNQKEELQASFDVIEHQNNDLKDSILYARRIQQAILPSTDLLAGLPVEVFVFYRPRDIVSGDFYWFGQVDDRLILAGCDCTGHGVPGAFMSVLGSSLLNQLAGEYRLTDPATLIDRLNDGVVNYLNRQNATDITLDGMDLALVSIDWRKQTLDFAGAFRPLWFFRNGEYAELKGSRRSVGGRQEKTENFENQQIKFQSGDAFYLFTDGITDQTGGETRRKLTPKRLREFLSNVQSLPVAEQRARLEQFMDEWQGAAKQLDDMLLIGARFV